MAKRYPLKTATTRVMPEDQAETFFQHLYHSVEWEEGIRSRKGFTRMAKSVDYSDPVLSPVVPYIRDAVKTLTQGRQYLIGGVYLNLYENGDMWTPSHTHPGQHQIVLSFGAERDLVIAKKAYRLKSGEAVCFGGASHGVPKDEGCDKPRISVAVFLLPVA